MLRAFASAARYLREKGRVLVAISKWLHATQDFLLDATAPSGWFAGAFGAMAATGDQVFLEDYAALALGLLELYQADFDNRWFVAARGLCRRDDHPLR